MGNGRNKVIDGVWFGKVAIQRMQPNKFRGNMLQVALRGEFSADHNCLQLD